MKQLLLDYQAETIRSALLEDGKLQEILIDKKQGGSLVGAVFNAVVQNVVPGRFAFLDIGLQKNAFLNYEKDQQLKQGQILPVQVRKDATAEKGANVSKVLQFKGQLALVYRGDNEIGISSKIRDKNERKRLQQLAATNLPNGWCCLLRTACESASEEEIIIELTSLQELCEETENTARYSPAPKKLYHEAYPFTELVNPQLDEIIINDEAVYNNYSKLSKIPIRLWNNEEPLYSAYNVEAQIKKALQRRVWLPCGAYITIDPTEACIFIDVNSGKYSGKKNYDESVLKINQEAATCITQQITLRNLSGMVIVDFINMPNAADAATVISQFRKLLNNCRIPTEVIGMTSLGLVQLTRRKGREPLHRLLLSDCPHCNGTGRIFDEATLQRHRKDT